ncbi:MAG: hypothetical protein D6806_18235, partial [Deltaproteobacteria bacterium]
MRLFAILVALPVLCSGCLNDLLDYGKKDKPCRDNGGCNEGLCCFKQSADDRGTCTEPGPQTCCAADEDCDDGAFCTLDSCSIENGQAYGTCSFEQMDCDDGDPCNGEEFCDEDTDACVSPGPDMAVPVPYPPTAHKKNNGTYEGDFFYGRYTGTNTGPEFRWHYEKPQCGFDVRFEIQLDEGETVPDFSSPEYHAEVDASVGTLNRWWAELGRDINTDTSGGKPFGTRYFWRVRACMSDQPEACSDWSHPEPVDVGRVPCDFNGDGYSDVLVGTDGSDSIYVFNGSDSGPGNTPSQVIDAPDGLDGFGRSVACAGDVNGDGFGDAVAGGNGKALVFFGSGAGLADTPALVIEGDQYDDDFGTVVARAGDVNGDGLDDILASSPMATAGYVKLVIGTDPAEEITIRHTIDARIDTNSTFGMALSTAGDTDNDGRDEFFIGAPQNRVGSGPTGTGAVCLVKVAQGDSGWQPELVDIFNADGDLTQDGWFGSAIAHGLFNGGLYQVAVGAPLDTLQAGGNGSVFTLDVVTGNSPVSDESPCDRSQGNFGQDVATVGNLQNDGQFYLVVGAPFASRQPSCNAALDAGGAAWVGTPTNFLWPAGASLGNGDSRFGSAVAGIGDVNRDGLWDFAVGAPAAYNAQGRVLVYWETAQGAFDFSTPRVE